MSLTDLRRLLPKLEVIAYCSPTNNNIWTKPEKGDIHCVLYKKKGFSKNEDEVFCHLVQLVGYSSDNSTYCRMGMPTFMSKI